jgi:hypothetical protein
MMEEGAFHAPDTGLNWSFLPRSKEIRTGRLGAAVPIFEPPEALLDRDAGLVAEVAAGGVDVEPVGRGELVGQEAGHRRLAAEAEGPVDGLGGGPAQEGHGGRHRAGDRRDARGAEDAVDQVPERPGVALREELGPARARGAGRQAVGGEQVGLGGVVDVD